MNPRYYQWLELIEKRDQAMAFITLVALAAIGAWLGLRDWQQVRRPFVYLAVVLYYASLLLAAVMWRGGPNG